MLALNIDRRDIIMVVMTTSAKTSNQAIGDDAYCRGVSYGQRSATISPSKDMGTVNGILTRSPMLEVQRSYRQERDVIDSTVPKPGNYRRPPDEVCRREAAVLTVSVLCDSLSPLSSEIKLEALPFIVGIQGRSRYAQTVENPQKRPS